VNLARGKQRHRKSIALVGAVAAWLAIVALERGAAAEWTVADVAIQPGGIVQGRIIPAETEFSRTRAAPHRVFVVRGEQTVAEAAVDSSGQFVLQRIAPGMVEVVLDSPESADRRSYRLWIASTAPPNATAELRLSESGQPVIRGQGSVLTMGFRKAAVITGIATGAIAAPIINHNIEQDTKPPHSP
jgi:hypothetical protein